MQAFRVALGLIQSRGARTVNAGLVEFGAAESDFLVRHVQKVRIVKEASARAVFAHGSGVPSVVQELLTCSDDEFEAHAQSLQDRLARAMAVTTSASDCVFCVVTTGTGSAEHATILKLDAVVEAARTSIEEGRVNLTVLTELIPEPGRLQKGLSWPDTRPTSDVIMIDSNVNAAQYFETAFDVYVSPRSLEAERQLHSAIVQHLPVEELPQAFEAASGLAGPVDQVLENLAEQFPRLGPIATELAREVIPTGLVRENKVAVLPLVWEADGASFSIPSHLASRVAINQSEDGDGWTFTFTSATKPTLGH
jgi:hypothetical protein